MVRTVFVVLAMLFSFPIFSQKYLVNQEVIEIPQTSRTIEKSFVTKDGQYVRVFNVAGARRQIMRGAYRGMSHRDLKQGLIFEDGKEVLLDNGVIISQVGKLILTKYIDYDSGLTQIYLYNIDGNNIQLSGTKSVNAIEGGFVLMENGATIFSDESEGHGKYVDFYYTSDLQHVRRYQPFANGFHSSHFSSNGITTVGVFSELDTKSEKLTVFNINGEPISEKIIDMEGIPSNVQFFGDIIIVYTSEQKILCFDTKGLLKWSIDILLPQFDVFNNSKNVIYLFTTDEMLCADAATGTTLSRLPLKALIKTSSADKVVRPVSFQIEDGVADFIISSVDIGALSIRNKKANSKFVRFDAHGKLVMESVLPPLGNELALKKRNGQLNVIVDSQILVYKD